MDAPPEDEAAVMDEEAEDQDGGEDGDDGDAKAEYVKKIYVANPEYVAQEGVKDEVDNSIVKNQRQLLSLRISRQRKEFGSDTFNFVEKEANENNQDLKANIKGILYVTKRKVLDIGLQAAHQMK